MASGKGSKGSTNAPEPPSAYGKGHDIETNGFGPDTVINRNANYGAKIADPSYGVSNKPIGDYQLGTNDPSRNYVTGTSRTKMAAGAEDNIWLKAGDGTGVSGTPGRKVSGSLGSTGLDVGKPKVPDVPEIAGKGINTDIKNSLKTEIKNIRLQMPNANLSKRGNMAIAEVNISGIRNKFVAHSKINSALDKGASTANFSYLKSENERLFTTYVMDQYPRYHDTEAKILEDIASQITDPNINGTINLYSELPCCQSCSNIILEFRRKYPNIKLNIFVG